MDAWVDTDGSGRGRPATDIRPVRTEEDVMACAGVAVATHLGLRSRHAWLPERTVEELATRVGWVAREGRVLGCFAGDELRGFLGWFTPEDFRCLGEAAFTPDWCLGAVDRDDAAPVTRALVRATLTDVHGAGKRIHAVGVHAHRDDIRNQLDLTGYGRIVMDAAQSTSELLGRLTVVSPEEGFLVRRAVPSDASALALMDGHLAAHITESPVLMPIPDQLRGAPAARWADWLVRDGTVAFVAELDGVPVGFAKAEEPQPDVSFTVHGAGTLAITGAWVGPAARRHGVATQLLRALADEALARNKDVVSVDCETTNPEAYGFWTRWFEPVSWSLERRW